MNHTQIWRAVDALAAGRGLTVSALARAAGLDPTTFNRSKRHMPDGRPRWPSTESVSRALVAADASWEEFAALVAGHAKGAGKSIPIVTTAQAGAIGFFDEAGFPVGAQETVRFPDIGGVYALEIADDSMAPAYRAGDVVIVQPGADVRRGDRVVVRTRDGDIMARVLGRRSDSTVELIAVNPACGPLAFAADEIDWIARIVWASQ
jgi:phage repressor protein C with HTH and peptisase S24 domain